MPENKRRETRATGDVFRVAEFSRRQFLKRTGVAAAGALITSIVMTTACKTRAITAGTPTESNTATGGLDTSNSPASSSAISSSNPADSNSTLTTSITGGFSYVSPTVSPPILPISGTTCTVATDRQYSTDNIWVKSLSDDVVVMGITTTMVEILYNPYNLSLLPVGSSVTADDAFGNIEGFKMSADLITPVSGTVIQINDNLISLAKLGTPIDPIINDPYNSGWMLVVQLSNLAELGDLVTPQKYIELVEKKY